MNHKSNSNALFIHNGAIGDFIVASRLMAISEEHFGKHRWTYLGKPALGRLAKSLQIIEHCEDFNRPGWHLLFSEEAPLPPPLQTFLKSFDLIVNLIAGKSSSFSTRLASLTTSADVKSKPILFHIDPKPPADFADHTLRYQANQMGFRLSSLPQGSYVVEQSVVGEVAAELEAKGIDAKKLVLFHPGASAAGKRCPLKHFYDLISQAKSANLLPGVLLGEVEQEQFSEADISHLQSMAIAFIGWPLEKIAGLLSIAHSYVGNDNGISHLAGAMGTPTTVIFLKDNSTMWRPLGPKIQITSYGTQPDTERNKR
jgi:ADP-heptose:LPS heptosyltransferase